MSRDVFLFLPIVIVFLTLLVALVLVIGGAVGLRRGQDGMVKTISAAAIIIGVMVVLVLGLSIFIGVNIFASLPFLFFLLGAFSVVVWIAILADCAINEPSQGNDKIVWVIIIVFTHILGAVLYLMVRRPQRIAETGR